MRQVPLSTESALTALVTAEIMKFRLIGDHVAATGGLSSLAQQLLQLGLKEEVFTRSELLVVIRRRLFELARDAFDEHMQGVRLHNISSMHALAFGLKHSMFTQEQRDRIQFELRDHADRFLRDEIADLEEQIYVHLLTRQEEVWDESVEELLDAVRIK